MATRDLEAAKAAYELGDVRASVAAHDAKVAQGPEGHKEEGKYVKNMVFGGLDGIITTFAIVAGVAGANQSVALVLVLGFANLVADGISMGFGDYISSTAENEYIMSERKREQWEFDNYPEGERKEMVELYMEKGFSEADATQIIDLMSRNTKFFVDHMMVQELGLLCPDEDDNPAKEGLITFCSFLAFGSVPLLSYLGNTSNTESALDLSFVIACILTVGMMFVLGVVQARITNRVWWRSALFVSLNGTLAAGSAFFIGWALAEITGVQHV
eukprot:TRINITY_DN52538_c0_g1_i1.p1 TRINITY_DN52538_c0_g1~~TRINITY_DN52538_c0_g1_i1.p1  ORF type:complete len:303 (-),score=152.47 TRINITY_DN52538_c0_g1_i1:95-910(-)